jgi:hypothetical protein
LHDSGLFNVHQLSTYSKLEDWLHGLASTKMPASQWLSTISELKGLRRDELEYLGVLDYLNHLEPSTKVLKAELIGKVTYHRSHQMLLQLVTRRVSQYRPTLKMESFSQELLPKKVRKLLVNTMVLDCFKFSSFNYRIVKFRFDGGWFGSIDTCVVFDNKWEQFRPKKSYTMLEAVDLIYLAITHKFKGYISTGDSPQYEYYSSLGKRSRYQEWLLSLPYWPEAFELGHFDLNNVVMHMRTSQWFDVGELPLMLVDEVQSDWHAQGRDNGYYGIGSEPQAEGQVPQAPFAKEWDELGVKLAIWIAVQKGFRRLAFVDAKVQVERYGSDLDGFYLLYDKSIPNILAKLAKEFGCEIIKTQIEVSVPKHRLKFRESQDYAIETKDNSSPTAYVKNYPVAMLYLRNKGRKIKRDLNVFVISDTLHDQINRFGIPLFGHISKKVEA